MSLFVVMTSSARMPAKCKGRYRNVAVVEIEGPELPKMISGKAKGVVRIVKHYGPQYEGRTCRCALDRTLLEANRLAAQLNGISEIAQAGRGEVDAVEV